MLFGRSLLPGRPTDLELCLSEAFAEQVDGLPSAVTITQVLDPALCPIPLLPFLAWEWSVDEWDSSWSDGLKRAQVAASWDIHSHKGTPAALQTAIDTLGFGAVVREWWQSGGAPYTFRLEITDLAGGAWPGAAFDQLYRVTLRAKNVRSWLEATNLTVAGSQAPIFVGAMVRTRVRVRPTPDEVTTLSGDMPTFFGAMVRTRIRARPIPS